MMSASSDSSTTSGKSSNWAPLSRSTAWIQTSRVRIHTVSDAGTVRPCAVRTGAAQRRLGQVPPLLVEPGDGVVEQISQRGRGQRGTVVDLAVAVLGRRVHRCLDAGRRPVQQPAQRRGVVADVGDQVLAGPAVQQRAGFAGRRRSVRRGAARRTRCPAARSAAARTGPGRGSSSDAYLTIVLLRTVPRPSMLTSTVWPSPM